MCIRAGGGVTEITERHPARPNRHAVLTGSIISDSCHGHSNWTRCVHAEIWGEKRFSHPRFSLVLSLSFFHFPIEFVLFLLKFKAYIPVHNYRNYYKRFNGAQNADFLQNQIQIFIRSNDLFYFDLM